MLTVATKMIIQILPDSWILRVAWNTVDPYTIPRPNHSVLRINCIRKCDRNIKYSAAVLTTQLDISRKKHPKDTKPPQKPNFTHCLKIQ